MPPILQAPPTVNVTLGAHTHVICLKPERRLGMGHIQCPDLKMEIQRHTTTCQGPLEPKGHDFLTLETCSAPCRWTLCWRSPIENSPASPFLGLRPQAKGILSPKLTNTHYEESWWVSCAGRVGQGLRYAEGSGEGELAHCHLDRHLFHHLSDERVGQLGRLAGRGSSKSH